MAAFMRSPSLLKLLLVTGAAHLAAAQTPDINAPLST